MLRQKRIIKKPVSYMKLYTELENQAKRGYKKLRNIKRCEFKIVPAPAAFVETSKIYLLYGDIILTEKDGSITPELSVLTKYSVFKNIEITQKALTKLARVRLERKEDIPTVAWNEAVERLESEASMEFNNWARLIKAFSLKYEDFMRNIQANDYKVAKNKEEERNYAEITQETEKKKDQLLEFFPCIYIKSRFEGQGIRITEIALNELFIKELGHTLDTFVTSVFQEGLPELILSDSEINHCTIQTLLDRYFSLGKEGLITPELNMSLLMKSGFVKKIQGQAHIYMNYEGGKFGIDLIFTTSSKQKPTFGGQVQIEKVVSKEFIEDMAQREKHMSDFLSMYYNESVTLRYNNFDKVCKIRELHRTKGGSSK